MDLSAVIFVVLALAWAVYLIPKALQHHDQVAAERLEESHSDHARVVSRRRRSAQDSAVEHQLAHSGAVVEGDGDPRVVEEVAQRPSRDSRRLRRRPRPELSPMGRAARNRRRVLGALLVVLAAVWGFTWFAYLPAITPLYPSLAVVAWLVLARRSVVTMKQRARLRPPASVLTVDQTAYAGPVVEEVAHSGRVVEEVAQQPSRDRLTTPWDTRPEVVAEQQALADDGSLWDPLPLTLPTYVGKATARRTVRTIELTGMTSSGHDETDSALAREAGATRAATEGDETPDRRAVGG